MQPIDRGLIMQNWNLVLAEGLVEAHQQIENAFNKQLEWWVFIPFIGIHRIRARQKLLRIGRYLRDQIIELNNGAIVPRRAAKPGKSQPGTSR